METVFHCCGMVEVARERLKSRAIGLLKTGAPSQRNQAGSPSSPVAVFDEACPKVEKHRILRCIEYHCRLLRFLNE